MKIIAIDDEVLAAHLLKVSLSEVFPNAQIEIYTDAEAFRTAIAQEKADLYFLDINIYQTSGIELAKELEDIHPFTNIFFLTGYEEYKGAAMDLYASDYILKPVSADKIRKAYQHLRYPIVEKSRYRAVTFGDFAFFVDDNPVTFHRNKSRELLAYLISKRGAVVSRSQLTMVLFEDETHSRSSQKSLDAACRTMLVDLEAVGANDLIYKGTDGLAVITKDIRADLFDFLDGNTSLFHGEFMEQYSWGEDFKALNLEFTN